MINYTRIVWERMSPSDDRYVVNRMVHGRLFSWTFVDVEDAAYYWRLQQSWDPNKQVMHYYPDVEPDI